MNIANVNLCGRNVYFRHNKKVPFGKIVSDYDFESKEVKEAYGLCADKGLLLVEVKKPTDG